MPVVSHGTYVIISTPIPRIAIIGGAALADFEHGTLEAVRRKEGVQADERRQKPKVQLNTERGRRAARSRDDPRLCQFFSAAFACGGLWTGLA